MVDNKHPLDKMLEEEGSFENLLDRIARHGGDKDFDDMMKKRDAAYAKVTSVKLKGDN